MLFGGSSKRGRLGADGEARARAYFEKHGCAILGQNVRLGRQEVDLIALDRGVTVFVEVKTRSTTYFGTPEESVGKKKLNGLARAMAYYVKLHPEVERVRIDVVAIEQPQGAPMKLRHWRSVGEGARLAFL